jgi:hypothetical protein
MQPSVEQWLRHLLQKNIDPVNKPAFPTKNSSCKALVRLLVRMTPRPEQKKSPAEAGPPRSVSQRNGQTPWVNLSTMKPLSWQGVPPWKGSPNLDLDVGLVFQQVSMRVSKPARGLE